MAAKPETLFIRACSTGKSDIVRGMIKDALSPDTRDTYGLTGLMWASRKGKIEVANVLAEGGADLEAKDRVGRTALFHAVAFKRYEVVEFLVAQGANHSPIDGHGWTPLDLASTPIDAKMVEILKRFGAQRKYSQEPITQDKKGANSFYTAGSLGGANIPIGVERIHIQLGLALRQWNGNYTDAIQKFCFSPFVDGSAVRFTERENILGVQKAKRKGDWLEVQIGVPESWWREEEMAYKRRLTDAIEDGLHSMIALLQRNRHKVNAELLMADWKVVKKEFLDTPAPRFPGEERWEAARSKSFLSGMVC